MKLMVFSSGSSGNCTLIMTDKMNILVDVGITKKAIDENLAKVGLSLRDISYVFITHEHTDHIKALPQLLKLERLRFVTSAGTLNAISHIYSGANGKELENLDKKVANDGFIILNRIEDTIMYPDLSFESLDVKVLPCFHDAAEPIGFVFCENGKRICYITDTGYVHRDLYDLITNCDAYILESNHDPELLMASSRPYYTKLRIVGDHGHLSNEDSMCILASVIGDNTKLIMHAHISQECNLSIIIEGVRRDVFKTYGIDRPDIEYVILGLVATKVYEI